MVVKSDGRKAGSPWVSMRIVRPFDHACPTLARMAQPAPIFNSRLHLHVSFVPTAFTLHPFVHVCFCGTPLVHLYKWPPLQVQYCCPLYAEFAQFQFTDDDTHVSSVPTGFD